MKSLWNDKEARAFLKDPLALRVYTSRLLGKNPSLVLHGGGNTSVKAHVTNRFGETEHILYVKGSGWDLATIEKGGFAPVKMDALLKMAKLKSLTDGEMVNLQRASMIDPYAPNPSVEAILHAIIPYQFVDHTHADSVVTVSNTPGGEKRIRELYGKNFLIVPYVMPGFILAKYVYDLTRGLKWDQYEGMILLHHGIFTFHDDAKVSYERMIKYVTKAEEYLKKKAKIKKVTIKTTSPNLIQLAQARQAVSKVRGRPVLARMKTDASSLGFANIANVRTLATQGPLTPDHVIRTRPCAAVLEKDPVKGVQDFVKDYQAYFKRHQTGQETMLDQAPRWAVWKHQGVLAFDVSVKDLDIISDVVDHTIPSILQADALGGWKVLPEKDIFEMEYWELEQAKLKKGGNSLALQGKVALVSGAASGIGKACVESLAAQGAAVVAVDINPQVTTLFTKREILGLACDVTQEKAIGQVLEKTMTHFGGLDILVSNAGIFPESEALKDLNPSTWEKSLNVNLTSHQRLLKACIPYLSLGINPTIIILASKNVPAPGPGVAAYSVAKAGLTQLARVAALELAPKGIRVNVLHPNQVFDTAIWTPSVLAKRAKHYGMSVGQYKTNNLLKTEITSADVARLVCTLAGAAFYKTTGAQIPIDGGNDRVI
jgi:rhamnose utilization protein RhaD (predicted bifunctional aldolase and dehydrogenase)/NAD(P)-dependent dehydrogenase (short-subunit alcohol dehydrogenase family)